MNLVRSWPQGQAGPTPLGWRLPQPLMPPRVNGWPMGVVPSSDAEALLESAVAYWDASRYRNGDRFLRNQGVAGELLDLRLGSSTVANSNDPTWLGPEATGYVYLPGVANNYLSVPDEAALDLVADIDIAVCVKLDTYFYASGALLSKYTISTNQRSWGLMITGSSGKNLAFWHSTTGTSGITTVQASADHPFVDGTAYWIRVTRNKSAGEVKFFWANGNSVTAPTSWTQIGDTITGVTTADLFSGSAPVEFGSYSGGASPVTGILYRAIVKDGIDGTTVLDVDCDAITSGSATSFTATTGQTVTINRSTSGRKSVAQPARGKGGRALWLLGTDDYFEVPAERVWQHQLLNFGQGDSFTVVAVVRQWNDQNGVMVAKTSGSYANDGWLLGSEVGPPFRPFIVQDGTTFSFARISGTYGGSSLQVRFGIKNDRALQSGATNATTATGTATTGNLRTTQPLTIGRRSVTPTYADMEFTAAAIFRRSLTAAEIQSITRYYGA